MSNRRATSPKALTEGVYDHLVTEELSLALEATTAEKDLVHLDDAEAPGVIARHLATAISRILAELPSRNRAEEARAFATRLLDHLASNEADHAATTLTDDRPVAPPRKLHSVHRGARPERPHTPLSTSTLLTRNRQEPALGHELGREIAITDRVDAIVAFVTMGGVRAIQSALETFSRKPTARFRLLTTTFTGTTEIKALDALARLPGAEVRISFDTRRTRLHAKAWLFHRDSGLSTAYIGSANLTSTALGSGQEWMVKVAARDLPHVIEKFAGTFETLWADEEFERYDPEDTSQRARLRAALSKEKNEVSRETFLVALRPFPHQEAILEKLEAERTTRGHHRNLVVAATGTGKTLIAAFDYQRQLAKFGGIAPRLLFIAHRKEILEQALDAFRHVLADRAFGELLTGGDEPTRFQHVFATIQSAKNLIARLGAGHFRHVIVDECHHSPAASYRAVIDAVTPDILVGLTATPERADGKSLLPDFDGHIAAELRLWSALEDQLLVPFEYFGISDGVDLRKVRWTSTGYDTATLGALYSGHHMRADLVRIQLERRVDDVRHIRALGFCVSVEHARFMAAWFTSKGIPSIALDGDTPEDVRAEAPHRLREREINVIFTCDLYNEGVDLPFVDTLLLLRPTQSATLFLQQLGRGLRHHTAEFPSKTSCLVLDFIGQHRTEFRFDAVLSAWTGIPKARLKIDIEAGFPYLPSGCLLELDVVARDTILGSLKTHLGGAVRLTEELRNLAASTPKPRLSQFLAHAGRDLSDVYGAGGWSTLRHRAGLLTLAKEEEASDIEEVSRRCGSLLHIDEHERLRCYGDLLQRKGASTLSPLERRRIVMLQAQLHHREPLRVAEQTLGYFAARPTIVSEIAELTEVLEARTSGASMRPVPEWSLALHHHYSRREIAVGVGFMGEGDKSISLQSGILKLEAQKREVLFVTLDKSGKSFSPTTRYADYAISRTLFHWETQSAASVNRPSGRRYLDSPDNGWSFFLFVRTDPNAVFAFLGPARYKAHTGDKPIGITWELETPMPASLFDDYATLRPG